MLKSVCPVKSENISPILMSDMISKWIISYDIGSAHIKPLGEENVHLKILLWDLAIFWPSIFILFWYRKSLISNWKRDIYFVPGFWVLYTKIVFEYKKCICIFMHLNLGFYSFWVFGFVFCILSIFIFSWIQSEKGLKSGFFDSVVQRFVDPCISIKKYEPSRQSMDPCIPS